MKYGDTKILFPCRKPFGRHSSVTLLTTRLHESLPSASLKSGGWLPLTSPPTRLHRGIRSIRCVFEIFVPESCDTLRRGLGDLHPSFLRISERQRSCLFCCMVRNSTGQQKHSTSSVRSCSSEDRRRKKEKRKSAGVWIPTPYASCTWETTGFRPRSVGFDIFIFL